MTPEQQRIMQAYIEMMMSGGDPGLAMGLGPTAGADPNTNTYQDRVQILGDPLTSSLGGLGAFDPAAFDPVISRNYVEAPGQSALLRWETSSPESVRGAMIQLMLGEDQLTPEEAYSVLLETVQKDPSGSIAMSVPPVMDRDGNVSTDPTAGLFSVYEEYRDVLSQMDADPTGLQYDNQTGSYYTQEMAPSELATKFRDEYMLPLPTESYLDPYRRVDGRRASGSVLEGEALAREMAAMPNPAPPREYGPQPQFRDYDAPYSLAYEAPEVPDPNAPFEPPRFSGWKKLGGLVQQAKEAIGDLPGLSGFQEMGDAEADAVAAYDALPKSIGTGIMPGRSRATGRIEDTLGAYAGMRGTPRSYEPITPRTSNVGIESTLKRRALQDSINQGVRSRFQGNTENLMYTEPSSADRLADDFYRSSALAEAGRTPMFDAMRTRLAQQQLAGF